MEPQNRSPFMRREKVGYSSLHSNKIKKPTDAMAKLKEQRNREIKKRKIMKIHNLEPVTSAVDRPTRFSDALKKFFNMIDNNKINLVDKFITEVDFVQNYEAVKTAETIFLSNNNITSLKNFSQFSNVSVLSLANNMVTANSELHLIIQITQLEELDYLKECTSLQTLNLENNPVTNVPNYRLHVVQRFPKLRMLDNKVLICLQKPLTPQEVTSAERKIAESTVKKEETMMNMIYNNWKLLQRLEKGFSKLRVHTDLRSSIFGKMSIANRADFPDLRWATFDVKKFLRLLDAEEYERRSIMEKLRNHVRYVYNARLGTPGETIKIDTTKDPMSNSLKNKAQKSPKKSTLSDTELWDRAFSEVMLSQQTQIATLLSEIEEVKQQADVLRSKYKHFDPNNTIPVLRNQQEKLDQVVKQERENLIQEFQTTIRKLENEFQDGFSMQFSDYEHKIQGLQKQVDDLTKSPHEKRNASYLRKPTNYSKSSPMVDSTGKKPPLPKKSMESPAMGNYKYDSLRAILPPQQQDPSVEEPRGKVSSTGKEIKPILSSEKNKIERNQPGSEKVAKKLQFADTPKGPQDSMTLRSTPVLQAYKSPEKSENVKELLQIISSLREELEARAEQEEYMNHVNSQLQRRLEIVQKYNDESALKTEKEANKMQSQVMSEKNQMAQRLSKAEDELAFYKKEIEVKEEELFVVTEELQNTEEKYTVAATKLKVYEDLEKKETLLREKHDQSLTKKWFTLLKKAVHNQKLEREEACHQADIVFRASLLHRYFSIWRFKHESASGDKRDKEDRKRAADQFFIQKFWDKWQNAVHVLKYRAREEQYAVQKDQFFTLRHALRRWKQAFEIRQQVKLEGQERRIVLHKRGALLEEKTRINTLRKFFRVWYVSCFHSLNDTFHSLRAEHNRLQEHYDLQSSKYEDTDVENYKLREKVEQLASENSRLQFQMTQKNIEVMELKQKLDSNMLEGTSSKSEIDRLNSVQRDVHRDLERSRKEVQKLQRELAEANEELEKLREDFDDKSIELESQQKRVKDLERAQQESLDRGSETDKQKNSQLEQTRRELREVTLELEKAKIEIKKSAAELERSALVQSQLRETIEDQEKELSGVRKEVEAEKRQHKKVVDALQAEAANKTTLAENYEKQLQEVSFRYDGETAEIQEKLTMAFEIASSLRKLLDDKETLLQQLKHAKDQQEIQIIQLKSKLDQSINKLENKTIELKELQHQFEEIKKNMQEYIKLLENKDKQIAKLTGELKSVGERDQQRTSIFLGDVAPNFPKYEIPELKPRENSLTNRAPEPYTKRPMPEYENPQTKTSAIKNNREAARNLSNSQIEGIYQEIKSLENKILSKLQTPNSILNLTSS